MSIGSLFAGIGGLELGLEWAGLGPTIWQVELDPEARHVLRRHWPRARRLHHVQHATRAGLPIPDVICGGFPCQDISQANHAGRGLDGERSGLWWMRAARMGTRKTRAAPPGTTGPAPHDRKRRSSALRLRGWMSHPATHAVVPSPRRLMTIDMPTAPGPPRTQAGTPQHPRTWAHLVEGWRPSWHPTPATSTAGFRFSMAHAATRLHRLRFPQDDYRTMFAYFLREAWGWR